ncbi:MAG: 1-acyl-sn-glycerol-3-phosphate acyltransferase [Gemmatimonadetes bacterium]|nr:1-acyl-sn-glycerol-3-phosphate acyltransferase [Gemmatimonadota bacterium]
MTLDTSPTPLPEPPLGVLAPFERAAVRLARAMHRQPWAGWCVAGQRQLGARWITTLAGPLLDLHGLEHVAATRRDRPLLLAANHRSFFDLYLVMAVLYRRLPGWRSTCFPVRGRYFYQRPGGVLLNALVAQWAMYPPFFREPGKRRFDQWALGELARLAREGEGRLIGFHPEGTRNRDPDPYSFLPPQPGIGRLMLDAAPTTVPVFIAGLPNGIGEIVRRRRRGGERIRLWFGPPLAYDTAGGDARVLAAQVMDAIAALAARDRERPR